MPHIMTWLSLINLEQVFRVNTSHINANLTIHHSKYFTLFSVNQISIYLTFFTFFSHSSLLFSINISRKFRDPGIGAQKINW